MSLDIGDRPAVISINPDIKDLLGFRHVFKRVYGKPLRLDEIIEKLHVVSILSYPNSFRVWRVYGRIWKRRSKTLLQKH